MPDARLLGFARVSLAIYWPLLFAATHWPRLSFDLENTPIEHMPLDKLLHVTAFVILHTLLYFTTNRKLVTATAIVLVYAWFDEITQQLSPGRTFSLNDVAANLIGILITFFVIKCTHRRVTTTTSTTDNTAPLTEKKSFVHHAMTVSILTLLSRVTGLVRDAAMAAAFGSGVITSAFSLGFLIPNLFRRLFGEGALSAAFVPTYTNLLKTDRQLAARFASVCMATLLIVLAGLTLISQAVLLTLLHTTTRAADTILAIRLTMIMLPYAPLICASALLAGILQVHHRFGPPAAAPVLLNIVLIVVIVITTAGVQYDAQLQTAIHWVAAAVLIAGVIQLLWHLAAVTRHVNFAMQFAGTRDALIKMLRIMGPMIVGLAVFQINTLFDNLIAWFFSPHDPARQTAVLLGYSFTFPISDKGSLFNLYLAQRLYQFPLGVFGIAIATAIFPALAHQATDHKRGDLTSTFRATLQQGLRLTWFIGLPAAAGLILIRLPLTRLLFERARFDLHDAQNVAWLLIGYASAVWAYAMTHVLTRAFYALNDSKTPLRISIITVILNLILNLTLIWFIGAAGLAWSTALCAMLQTALLIRAIRRHVAPPIDTTVIRAWLKVAAITAIMTASLYPLIIYFDPATLSPTHTAALLAAMLTLGLTIFTIGAKLLHLDELHWLLHRKTH